MARLDYTSLEKALFQLEDALAVSQRPDVRSDESLFIHVRAGAIQAFEFSYETCYKLLKRTLAEQSADPGLIDTLSFDEVVRLAYQQGLTEADVNTWRAFRRSRGTTSHAYDFIKAEEVFEQAPIFLAEAKKVLKALQAL